MTSSTYRFGRFELRTATRELCADGLPQRVGERAFDLLQTLAEAGGAVVLRDTLFERAWPGRVVSDDNLKVQVMALRKLLGADAVVTVPGRGYRLGLPLHDGSAQAAAAAGAGAASGTAVSAHAAGAGGPAAAIAAAAGSASAAGGLVGPSGLIGREHELAALRAALAPGRVLSLVGPGGAGKTRLAAAAADAERARHADGVAWVELAALTDPAQLPAAVAQALRLPEAAQPADAARIADALKPLQLLLVLDNCEHLLPAAAALAAAVNAAAPQVTLLATSQAPLALRNETVQRLHGLALPGDAAAPSSISAKAGSHAASAADWPAHASAPIDAPAVGPSHAPSHAPPHASPDAPSLAPSPALALFLARARAADPGLDVEAPGIRAAAADICRRLEGLPLALELAAARVPLLGVAGLRDRLDQQLQLLTRGAADAPARQQTLRATLAWSHALLDETQRTVFRRLAVFADSFTLAAAQAVAGDAALDEWAVLDAVDALAARSLLRPVDAGSGERRFSLLVTARAFALEQLAAAGEHDATMRRLATHLVQVHDTAERHFLGAPLRPWMERLWPGRHDLRAALQWVADRAGDEQLLLSLVAAAGPFWAAAGLDREAAPWLARVKPLADAAGTPDALMARYCKAVALRIVNPTAPPAESVAAAERGAALYEAQGDVASAYRLLGIAAQHGRRADPQRDLQPLFARLRALEQPEWSGAMRLIRLRAEGVSMARGGDWTGYRERFQLESALLAEAGDELRAWGSLYHVALAELALKRPQAAIAVLQPVVQRLRETGRLREQWTRPVLLALARIEAGEAAAAAPAVREAVTLLRVAGAPAWCADHFAWWVLDCGDAALGARLAGWADATVRRTGQKRHAHAQAAHDAVRLRLAGRLGAAEEQRLRGEGEAFDDELALLRVLQAADASIMR
jgi:predicted ATPase/DNA-binding winged helix-turn-helix (wHTH) protein